MGVHEFAAVRKGRHNSRESGNDAGAADDRDSRLVEGRYGGLVEFIVGRLRGHQTSLPPLNRHRMNGTRIGPLTIIQTSNQVVTKSITNAGPGTFRLPGTPPAASSTQTSNPSLIAVTRPNSVGQSF